MNFPAPQTARPGDDIPDDILRQFVQSSESAAEQLESAALALERDTADGEALSEARRVLHTIKGETGFLGLNTVSQTCHDAESALEETIGRDECPTDLLLEVKDWLDAVIGHLASSQAVDDAPPETPWPQPEPGPPAATASRREAPAPPLRAEDEGLRILICEDMPVAQKLLSLLLARHGRVDVADNGRIGVEKFAAALEEGRPFDLVCLDIMMPEMDGQEALAGIRALEEERGIRGLDGAKIIMTTALDDAKNVMKAFRQGCEAYIVKPVTKAKLLEQLRELRLVD